MDNSPKFAINQYGPGLKNYIWPPDGKTEYAKQKKLERFVTGTYRLKVRDLKILAYLAKNEAANSAQMKESRFGLGTPMDMYESIRRHRDRLHTIEEIPSEKNNQRLYTLTRKGVDALFKYLPITREFDAPIKLDIIWEMNFTEPPIHQLVSKFWPEVSQFWDYIVARGNRNVIRLGYYFLGGSVAQKYRFIHREPPRMKSKSSAGWENTILADAVAPPKLFEEMIMTVGAFDIPGMIRTGYESWFALDSSPVSFSYLFDDNFAASPKIRPKELYDWIEFVTSPPLRSRFVLAMKILKEHYQKRARAVKLLTTGKHKLLMREFLKGARPKRGGLTKKVKH